MLNLRSVKRKENKLNPIGQTGFNYLRAFFFFKKETKQIPTCLLSEKWFSTALYKCDIHALCPVR